MGINVDILKLYKSAADIRVPTKCFLHKGIYLKPSRIPITLYKPKKKALLISIARVHLFLHVTRLPPSRFEKGKKEVQKRVYQYKGKIMMVIMVRAALKTLQSTSRRRPRATRGCGRLDV